MIIKSFKIIDHNGNVKIIQCNIKDIPYLNLIYYVKIKQLILRELNGKKMKNKIII